MPEGSLRLEKFSLCRFFSLQRTLCLAVPLLFVLSPLSCASNVRLSRPSRSTGDSPNGEEASLFTDAFRALRASLARSLPYSGTVNDTPEEPPSRSRGPANLPGTPSLQEQEHSGTGVFSSLQDNPGTPDSTARQTVLARLAKHLVSVELRRAGTMAPFPKHPCLQQLSKDVEAIKRHGLKGEEAAKAFVDALQRCGVKVVATDYDRTLISAHSGELLLNGRFGEL